MNHTISSIRHTLDLSTTCFVHSLIPIVAKLACAYPYLVCACRSSSFHAVSIVPLRSTTRDAESARPRNRAIRHHVLQSILHSEYTAAPPLHVLPVREALVAIQWQMFGVSQEGYIIQFSKIYHQFNRGL